ncbi:MAG TPA: hypothetical protein PL098_00085 [Brevundimonas diminuta]|nr:hypothetical protein [Brevundimonas diminuta]HRL23302.1 hypothetical protein [Brevundimonas diminuta]
MGRIIGLLPSDAAALLTSAAATGTPGSLQRRKAIEAAQKRIREMYPQLFKEENENHESPNP